MPDQVIFYQLTRKFVHDDKDIPEGPRQVMYYSLAIGHHVGMLDCFQKLMSISIDDYRRWLDRIPEGTGRHKLEGLLKWGEIEINQSHAKDLLPILSDGDQSDWLNQFRNSLQQMIAEPALYMMVRTV